MTIVMRMLPSLSLASLLLAGAAHAETRASATVGVEGGYGSNPALSNGSGNAGSITGRIAPVVTILGPTTQLDLNGRLEQIVFTKGYDDMTNWTLGGELGVTLSPRSKLSISAGYSSYVQSAFSDISTPPGAGELPQVDPDLGGQRIENLDANASFSSQVSARDSLTVSAFVGDVNYDGVAFAGNSYTSYGTSIGLSHAMNSRTSLGGSVAYTKSNYDVAANGSFQQISPSVNASLKLSPRLTLNVSTGVSFSQSKMPTGSSKRTHFSGSADMCYAGLRSNVCASASRSVGSTARTGNSTITTATLTYGYKLTARSSLNLNGRYSDSKSVDATFGNSSYSYGVASANYQRQLGQRLSFSVSARYTEPFKSVNGGRRGFYGGAGVNYRLGR
jgi:hypothetical protein